MINTSFSVAEPEPGFMNVPQKNPIKDGKAIGRESLSSSHSPSANRCSPRSVNDEAHHDASTSSQRTSSLPNSPERSFFPKEDMEESLNHIPHLAVLRGAEGYHTDHRVVVPGTRTGSHIPPSQAPNLTPSRSRSATSPLLHIPRASTNFLTTSVPTFNLPVPCSHVDAPLAGSPITPAKIVPPASVESAGDDNRDDDDVNTEEDVCCICLECYTEDNPMSKGTCQHHFHLPCLMNWKQRSNTCPMCCAQSLHGVGDEGVPIPPRPSEDVQRDEEYAAKLQRRYARKQERERKLRLQAAVLGTPSASRSPQGSNRASPALSAQPRQPDSGVRIPSTPTGPSVGRLARLRIPPVQLPTSVEGQGIARRQSGASRHRTRESRSPKMCIAM